MEDMETQMASMFRNILIGVGAGWLVALSLAALTVLCGGSMDGQWLGVIGLAGFIALGWMMRGGYDWLNDEW